LGGEVLLNDAFSVEEVAKALSVGGYSIVHLATHGVFVSEASNSYLLAYDDKFSLDLLGETVGTRRFIGDPLDLLVLSACETAAGDNRAALGLAGVSLKAGARSTVASLWTISDAGTFELMTSFYRYLGKKMGKAEALRSAQMDLLGNNRFSHPNYWAPFLLIGNWQ
jgi:CHAT domain-containing protein